MYKYTNFHLSKNIKNTEICLKKKHDKKLYLYGKLTKYEKVGAKMKILCIKTYNSTF